MVSTGLLVKVYTSPTKVYTCKCIYDTYTHNSIKTSIPMTALWCLAFSSHG